MTRNWFETAEWRIASIVRLISYAPDMKTSTSPSVSLASRSSSSAAASHTGVSPSGRSRYSISTGNVRPREVSSSHGWR